MNPLLSSESSNRGVQPVFGLVLFGGSLSGALVRDVRLANELVRRGYTVHVWWVMDRQKTAALAAPVQQHWLFNGMRFWGSPRGSAVLEWVGRALHACFSDRARAHMSQSRASIPQRIMRNLTIRICEGVQRDRSLVSRFARELDAHRVTHVLPMLEFLCPWVAAARTQMSNPCRYMVTFQGYELYSTYARAMNRERDLYARLVETVEQSDWPAIAVSEDYLRRVVEDIGVPAESLRAIPPGVPSAKRMDERQAREVVKARFPEFQSDLPLIAFLGRRDTEKGIDLLLYAARMLTQRGCRFQLAICGPTLWGDHYGRICRQIAEELRLPVMWRRFVPDEVRTAIFSLAHCIVYPSIHREPFGMVAAEANAHGTPAIVPDYGGVAGAIEANGEIAGLRFTVWDSGDLADQIQKLLEDRSLHQRLSAAGPRVAEHFSIENLGDRVLKHLGLPAHS